MPRTLPILYIQTSHTESFQSDKYKLPIQNTSNLIHTNFTYRTLPILYIQTSHTEHFQSYTYKLHILNTSNRIHTNLT